MSAQTSEAAVKFPYVQPLPTGWRYRRRILPTALAKAIGHTEWKSAIYKTEGEANAASAQLAPLHDAVVRRWKAGEVFELAELLALRNDAQATAIADMMANAFNAWAEAGAKGHMELLPKDRAALAAIDSGRPLTMPLSAAYARDAKEYGGSRDEKYVKFAVDKFIAWVGDRDFFELKRADVELWIKKAKAFGWAPGTVKRRSVALQGIHSRLLIAFDLPASSVWRKLDYGVAAGGAADDRLPLNAEHLKALDAYLPKAKPRTRHALTLMKLTGIGPKELIGLRVRDFVFDHAIPHVIVRPHDDRRLKTATRSRSVPLIGEALKAAKAAVKAAPGEFVFVKEVKTNSAQSLSALGNEVIRAAGIPKSPRLTCYSLRHGIAEAMQQANVRENLRKYVLGHSQKGVTAKYGASAPMLAELASELTRAHGFLGRVDDSIYEPGELMPKKGGLRARV
ncbi:tyrosine-type recombinase/integrase [Terricaulis sp.]|uniref:tyrosine-type recombinase/integrase n=1 Tax=Terricaulis sp. TaxID=2768686 RepID=UPI002AC4F97F|nr:tyrosine-type recombinase/integrase [Terricaulis sp.]MDZ4693411.1 tyrosine-type recombinase/integrase [Terricaulis sp.]